MYEGATIGVVVPAYDEQRHVAGVLESIPSYVDRIYVIDDHSTDRTWEIVRRYADEIDAPPEEESQTVGERSGDGSPEGEHLTDDTASDDPATDGEPPGVEREPAVEERPSVDPAVETEPTAERHSADRPPTHDRSAGEQSDEQPHRSAEPSPTPSGDDADDSASSGRRLPSPDRLRTNGSHHHSDDDSARASLRRGSEPESGVRGDASGGPDTRPGQGSADGSDSRPDGQSSADSAPTTAGGGTTAAGDGGAAATGGGGATAAGDAVDPYVVAIRHERNRGYGGAVVTGYRRGLADGMDVIATISGDGQMDADLLHRFLDPIVTGQAGYAKGNRLATSWTRREMSRWRTFGNALLTGLTRVASGYWGMTDPQNGYTAISARTLEGVPLDELYERYGFLNDLLVRLNARNVTVADVPHRAVYGDEESGIAYRSFVPGLSALLAVRLFERLLAAARYDGLAVPGCYLVGVVVVVAAPLVAPVGVVVGLAVLAAGILLDVRANADCHADPVPFSATDDTRS